MKVKIQLGFILCCQLLVTLVLNGQTLNSYNIEKIDTPLVIDGKLDEVVWQNAPLTEKFVHYETGALLSLSTQAKMLWDDTYWYIGFICEDTDVWATMTNRDDWLWYGEVVEIFIDPDGDGLNYLEIQVNPLNTLTDLLVSKAYYLGGTGNFNWNLQNIQTGIWVYGTLNDSSDTDSSWTCEVAIPFNEIEFCAPSIAIPPENGDTFRLLLTRYDYERGGDSTIEVTAWNQTDNRGFHVPTKFGFAIFSDSSSATYIQNEEGSNAPDRFKLFNNYPNPFNPNTKIRYSIVEKGIVELKVYDILGREVFELVNREQIEGSYEINFNAYDLPSGIYYYKLQMGEYSETKKAILLK
jgi:hypothetical protein